MAPEIVVSQVIPLTRSWKSRTQLILGGEGPSGQCASPRARSASPRLRTQTQSPSSEATNDSTNEATDSWHFEIRKPNCKYMQRLLSYLEQFKISPCNADNCEPLQQRLLLHQQRGCGQKQSTQIPNYQPNHNPDECKPLQERLLLHRQQECDQKQSTQDHNKEHKRARWFEAYDPFSKQRNLQQSPNNPVQFRDNRTRSTSNEQSKYLSFNEYSNNPTNDTSYSNQQYYRLPSNNILSNSPVNNKIRNNQNGGTQPNIAVYDPPRNNTRRNQDLSLNEYSNDPTNDTSYSNQQYYRQPSNNILSNSPVNNKIRNNPNGGIQPNIAVYDPPRNNTRRNQEQPSNNILSNSPVNNKIRNNLNGAIQPNIAVYDPPRNNTRRNQEQQSNKILSNSPVNKKIRNNPNGGIQPNIAVYDPPRNNTRRNQEQPSNNILSNSQVNKKIRNNLNGGIQPNIAVYDPPRNTTRRNQEQPSNNILSNSPVNKKIRNNLNDGIQPNIAVNDPPINNTRRNQERYIQPNWNISNPLINKTNHYVQRDYVQPNLDVYNSPTNNTNYNDHPDYVQPNLDVYNPPINKTTYQRDYVQPNLDVYNPPTNNINYNDHPDYVQPNLDVYNSPTNNINYNNHRDFVQPNLDVYNSPTNNINYNNHRDFVQPNLDVYNSPTNNINYNNHRDFVQPNLDVYNSPTNNTNYNDHPDYVQPNLDVYNSPTNNTNHYDPRDYVQPNLDVYYPPTNNYYDQPDYVPPYIDVCNPSTNNTTYHDLKNLLQRGCVQPNIDSNPPTNTNHNRLGETQSNVETQYIPCHAIPRYTLLQYYSEPSFYNQIDKNKSHKGNDGAKHRKGPLTYSKEYDDLNINFPTNIFQTNKELLPNNKSHLRNYTKLKSLLVKPNLRANKLKNNLKLLENKSQNVSPKVMQSAAKYVDRKLNIHYYSPRYHSSSKYNKTNNATYSKKNSNTQQNMASDYTQVKTMNEIYNINNGRDMFSQYKDDMTVQVREWFSKVPFYPIVDPIHLQVKENAVNKLVENVCYLICKADKKDYKQRIEKEINKCLEILDFWLPQSVITYNKEAREQLLHKCIEVNDSYMRAHVKSPEVREILYNDKCVSLGAMSSKHFRRYYGNDSKKLMTNRLSQRRNSCLEKARLETAKLIETTQALRRLSIDTCQKDSIESKSTEIKPLVGPYKSIDPVTLISHICLRKMLYRVLSNENLHKNKTQPFVKPKHSGKSESYNLETQSNIEKSANKNEYEIFLICTHVIKTWIKKWLVNLHGCNKNITDMMIYDLTNDLIDERNKNEMKFELIITKWLERLNVNTETNNKQCFEDLIKILHDMFYEFDQKFNSFRQSHPYFKCKSIGTLKDKMKYWMLQQPAHCFKINDQRAIVDERSQYIHDKYATSSTNAELVEEVTKWVPKAVNHSHVNDIDKLTKPLTTKIFSYPRDSIIVANANVDANAATNEPSGSRRGSQATNIDQNTENIDHTHQNIESTMMALIAQYIRYIQDVEDPMARKASAQILKDELQKVCFATRKEIYDNFTKKREPFSLENMTVELFFAIEISEWLKNILIDASFNTLGNRNRITLTLDLAKSLADAENQRLSSPQGLNFNEYLAGIICRFIYVLPIMSNQKENVTLMNRQLVTQIASRRPIVENILRNRQPCSPPNIVDFIENYIQVKGREYADDDLRFELWTARVIKEVMKIIYASNPEAFTKIQVYDRLANVTTTTDETVKFFVLELEYAKEISDWLRNLLLAHTNERDSVKEVVELAEKITGLQIKTSDPNNKQIETELQDYIMKWIRNLPVDQRRNIDEPTLVKQLITRIYSVNQPKNEERRKERRQSSQNGGLTSFKIRKSSDSPMPTQLKTLEPHPNSQKNMSSVLVDIIENWCANLPIANGNKEEVQAAKDKITRDLFWRIGQLHENPQLHANHLLYKDMIAEKLDEALNTIPNNVEIQVTEEAKERFLKEIMNATNILRQMSAGQSYVERLQNSLESSMPNPRIGLQSDDVGFKIYKNRLAAMFLLDNFDHCDEVVKSQYKRRIKTEIDKYFSSAQMRNSLPLNKDVMYNELYSALYKLPAPDENLLANEVEVIKTRCELDSWIERLPLRPVQNMGEAFQNHQILTTLARRLHQIETEEENPDEKMHKEIIKFLRILPLFEQINIVEVATDLQNTMKLTVNARKHCKASNNKKTDKNVDTLTGELIQSGNAEVPINQKRASTISPGCMLLKDIESLCNGIPFPSNTIQDQQKAKEIKDDLVTSILRKFDELNDDSKICNDEAMYEYVLGIELDKILKSTVPQNIPIDRNHLKNNLINKISSIKFLLKTQKRVIEYKKNLQNVAYEIIGMPDQVSKTRFEDIQNEVVEGFIEYLHNVKFGDKRTFHKEKIQNTLNDYYNDNTTHVDCLLKSNQLICELTKVPPPNSEILTNEILEIRMRNQINEILKNLLQTPSPERKTDMGKIITRLAKRLCEIEKTGYNPENEEMMKHEVNEALKHLKISDKPNLVNDFINQLKNSVTERRSCLQNSMRLTGSQTVDYLTVPGVNPCCLPHSRTARPAYVSGATTESGFGTGSQITQTYSGRNTANTNTSLYQGGAPRNLYNLSQNPDFNPIFSSTIRPQRHNELGPDDTPGSLPDSTLDNTSFGRTQGWQYASRFGPGGSLTPGSLSDFSSNANTSLYQGGTPRNLHNLSGNSDFNPIFSSTIRPQRQNELGPDDTPGSLPDSTLDNTGFGRTQGWQYASGFGPDGSLTPGSLSDFSSNANTSLYQGGAPRNLHNLSGNSDFNPIFSSTIRPQRQNELGPDDTPGSFPDSTLDNTGFGRTQGWQYASGFGPGGSLTPGSLPDSSLNASTSLYQGGAPRNFHNLSQNSGFNPLLSSTGRPQRRDALRPDDIPGNLPGLTLNSTGSSWQGWYASEFTPGGSYTPGSLPDSSLNASTSLYKSGAPRNHQDLSRNSGFNPVLSSTGRPQTHNALSPDDIPGSFPGSTVNSTGSSPSQGWQYASGFIPDETISPGSFSDSPLNDNRPESSIRPDSVNRNLPNSPFYLNRSVEQAHSNAFSPVNANNSTIYHGTHRPPRDLPDSSLNYSAYDPVLSSSFRPPSQFVHELGSQNLSSTEYLELPTQNPAFSSTPPFRSSGQLYQELGSQDLSSTAYLELPTQNTSRVNNGVFPTYQPYAISPPNADISSIHEYAPVDLPNANVFSPYNSMGRSGSVAAARDDSTIRYGGFRSPRTLSDSPLDLTGHVNFSNYEPPLSSTFYPPGQSTQESESRTRSQTPFSSDNLTLGPTTDSSVQYGGFRPPRSSSYYPAEQTEQSSYRSPSQPVQLIHRGAGLPGSSNSTSQNFVETWNPSPSAAHPLVQQVPARVHFQHQPNGSNIPIAPSFSGPVALRDNRPQLDHSRSLGNMRSAGIFAGSGYSPFSHRTPPEQDGRYGDPYRYGSNRPYNMYGPPSTCPQGGLIFCDDDVRFARRLRCPFRLRDRPCNHSTTPCPYYL